ncbi:hypothetical protein [Candidatus Uabimicrobium amorphum]|uniref:Uncharacterized protein n=1 Tax=Uabimicrobium amorphum TaxID=2596890 RepID=A0A5S9IMC6_UABAM|nr:hypothetical protein [Candidatus Uabimicrobium amorphum]BBM84553.1 hypothetical protein UABAM_02914 [Candidatus Uabimicrobium amorphum]
MSQKQSRIQAEIELEELQELEAKIKIISDKLEKVDRNFNLKRNLYLYLFRKKRNDSYQVVRFDIESNGGIPKKLKIVACHDRKDEFSRFSEALNIYAKRGGTKKPQLIFASDSSLKGLYERIYFKNLKENASISQCSVVLDKKVCDVDKIISIIGRNTYHFVTWVEFDSKDNKIQLDIFPEKIKEKMRIPCVVEYLYYEKFGACKDRKETYLLGNNTPNVIQYASDIDNVLGIKQQPASDAFGDELHLCPELDTIIQELKRQLHLLARDDSCEEVVKYLEVLDEYKDVTTTRKELLRSLKIIFSYEPKNYDYPDKN